MSRKAIFILGISLFASPRAHAMLVADIEELRHVETEQDSRLKAIQEREKSLTKMIRDKSKTFHALKQSSSAASYIWEDDSKVPRKHHKLERMLQISIREDLREVETLENQEIDLKAELEWVRLRLKEALENPSVVPPPGEAKVVSDFRCQDLPVSPASGKSLSLLQDFGTRKDADTGIEWRSLGWWITDASQEVHACSSGTVVFSGKVPGRGRVIVLDHGAGGMTLYANLNDDPGLVLHKGEIVKAGKILGTPREKFYFEVRRNGAAVNPRDVLSATMLARYGL